jgi:hypothetical protein
MQTVGANFSNELNIFSHNLIVPSGSLLNTEGYTYPCFPTYRLPPSAGLGLLRFDS